MQARGIGNARLPGLRPTHRSTHHPRVALPSVGRPPRCYPWAVSSCQDILHDVTGHIREAEIAADVAVRESFMVDAHEV